MQTFHRRGKQVLPLIEVQAQEVCEMGFCPTTGRTEPIGDAFWFDWEAVAEAARSQGMNLDRFLTLRLASFFASKRLRSNVLICYAPYQNRFMLSVCSKRQTNFLKVLHSSHGMPGYLEYGQDYVPPTAAPFLFYGGMQLYRVYHIRERPSSANYVCDFGNAFGLCVSESDPDGYERIRDEMGTYVDYSAVPIEPSEEIDLDGTSVTLQHAFCKWRR